THYQLEAEETSDITDRVTSALRHVGIPMILTTISTVAGFLSLLATDVRPIRQLGMFVALGITYAGIISFFFLPALMSRLTGTKSAHQALIGPQVTAGLKSLARSRVFAFALVGVILTFGAVFIPRLEVDSDQLFFFKDDHEVRLAFDRIEAAFGGATPLIGEFSWSSESGPADLAELQRVSNEMEALPGIRDVFSVADLAGALPAEQLAGVLAGQVALPLGDMVSEDGLRFVVFPDDFTSTEVGGWLEYADSHDEVRVLTGMPILWDEVAKLVLRAQVGSLIAAFALVAIMLAVSYRRLRETLVALVPIFLTVVTLLGFIAASGIQLNLITAIVSSIVIGVGIDYTIHFIAAHLAARGEADPTPAAIDRAGRPIVANALGIALGLTALWLSPLKPHGHISLIMWVSMVTAALTAVTVLPTLLGSSRKDQSVYR
ncbi:MAG: MMPL family transporter, partial [Acidimicrobiia bacterium]|nr:MMPL family transporter [Acidimicrobiia bacterium]